MYTPSMQAANPPGSQPKGILPNPQGGAPRRMMPNLHMPHMFGGGVEQQAAATAYPVNTQSIPAAYPVKTQSTDSTSPINGIMAEVVGQPKIEEEHEEEFGSWLSKKSKEWAKSSDLFNIFLATTEEIERYSYIERLLVILHVILITLFCSSFLASIFA